MGGGFGQIQVGWRREAFSRMYQDGKKEIMQGEENTLNFKESVPEKNIKQIIVDNFYIDLCI